MSTVIMRIVVDGKKEYDVTNPPRVPGVGEYIEPPVHVSLKEIYVSKIVNRYPEKSDQLSSVSPISQIIECQCVRVQ